MGAVQLPDEFQRVIEQQVVEGCAASPAAFLEQAIMRLVDEAYAEGKQIRAVVEAGSADVEAGRYTTVSALEDRRCLHERMMSRVQARQCWEVVGLLPYIIS